MKKIFFWLVWSGFFILNAQEKTEPIEVLHADKMVLLEKYPGQKLLIGHVELKHKEAVLSCDKAILDTKKNFAEASGNVFFNQGDTLYLEAEILRYDGRRNFSVAINRVFLRTPGNSLRTDTLIYDRQEEIAYYRSGGTIRDTVNTINSRTGNYYIKKNLYEFIGDVRVDNPDYRIESAHLQYNTKSRTVYFLGPTDIYGKNNDVIYAEKGFYDTQSKSGWFSRNALVRSGKKWMSADSIYLDKSREFYSATGHVKMQDPDNKIITLAGYVEQWNLKDSVFLDKHPVVINYGEKDTLYLGAQHIFVKKQDSSRIFWAYPGVKFYQKGFSGRCDSLFRDDRRKQIELYKRPVLWSEDAQITGRSIIVKSDSTGKNPDSLLIPQDVFIIQKDSAGYNQIKGKTLKGKFIDGKLRHIDIIGNTETIYYVRNEKNKLIGIDKSVCSAINIDLNTDGKIEKIYLRDHPSGTTYPPGKFPEALKKLPGFLWRGNERIRSKEEILDNRSEKITPPSQQHQTDKPEPLKIPARIFKHL